MLLFLCLCKGPSLFQVIVWDYSVPMACLVFRGTQNLEPVATPDFLRRISSDIDHTHLVISAKPVIIHDPDLETDLFDVHSRNVKLERLVVDWNKCILLNLCLPLGNSLVLMDHVNLHIGICGQYVHTKCTCCLFQCVYICISGRSKLRRGGRVSGGHSPQKCFENRMI